MSMKIVLHCSDSSFGNAALISKWHALPKPQGRGWTGIGYHYVVLNGWLSSKHYNGRFDGHIETGRPLDGDPFISSGEIGAHVKGQNRNSVGICLIGKSGDFTKAQLLSALKLIKQLEDQFGSIEICQHSYFDKGKPFCAGIDLDKLKKYLKKYKKSIKHI